MKREVTVEDYYKRAKEFSKTHQVEVSDHIIDIMASVMMTRDNVRQGGSFVTAVVNNKLYESISRADKECLQQMRIIAICSQDCFVY